MATTLEALRILATNLYENIDVIPGSSIIKDYVKRSYQNDPFRVALEALLLFFAIKYMTNKKYNLDSNYVKLTKKEIDELVEEWKPEALVAQSNEEGISEPRNQPIIKKFEGPDAILSDGSRFQTWSVSNFVGLHNNGEMKFKCADVVKKYGVGTCGPSGFYGTIDIHLDLQKELSQALGTEGASIYAQGYSAVSSVIPAFSKKGDIIVADECVNFAIQRGLTLSKSKVYFYKHNDMKDLESILNKIENEQKKKKTPLTRRFIVSEGLFLNTGSIVPLPELVSLKKKYKYRLILDESLSFGSLGSRCYGVTDFFKISSSEIEIIAGSFSNSLGSAGGFCAGDKNIVDHQVLSSQAYCYSASLPAFLAATAITNLQKLSKDGTNLAQKLSSNINTFRKHFSPYPNKMELSGNINSPLIYLCFAEDSQYSGAEQGRILDDIVFEMKKYKILLTTLKTVEKDERLKHKPMIKISISAGYDMIQTEKFAAQLLSVSNNIVNQF